MIRVLRLMEYEYPDMDAMDKDQANWAVPPIGSKNFTNRPERLIRSTILTSFGAFGVSAQVLELHKERAKDD